MTETVPRYAPEIPFPPYAYVPGQHPHPVSDPAGHSVGRREHADFVPGAEPLAGHADFRFGVDLFNRGYYWEAHEVWEGLWHACGRVGCLADFLKGLIRLSAAGVKAREGNPAGVVRHARRVRELFLKANNEKLANLAGDLISNPPSDPTVTVPGRPVLPIRIRIEDLLIPPSDDEAK